MTVTDLITLLPVGKAYARFTPERLAEAAELPQLEIIKTISEARTRGIFVFFDERRRLYLPFDEEQETEFAHREQAAYQAMKAFQNMSYGKEDGI